jgi:hypothetical protein
MKEFFATCPFCNSRAALGVYPETQFGITVSCLGCGKLFHLGARFAHSSAEALQKRRLSCWQCKSEFNKYSRIAQYRVGNWLNIVTSLKCKCNNDTHVYGSLPIVDIRC